MQRNPDPVGDGVVNVGMLEPRARAVLPARTWDYLSGGAGDEHTLRWNVERWASVRLAPRVLVDATVLDTSLTLLGAPLAHPVLLAPAATHLNFHPDGEAATIAGARAADALWCLSTLGSMSVAEAGVVSTGHPWWFQLYAQTDRDFTVDLARRAAAAGAAALVLTVDTPSLGARDRDKRNDTGAVPGVAYPNLPQQPLPRNDDRPLHRRIHNPHLASDLQWADVERLAAAVDIPLVLKGILRPDDARRALHHGAAAVVVSNHGGRNLDTAPATVDALPGVVHAVAGEVPVLVDGGIRRGTDVAKALCLGAAAVLVGRPYLWGLAAYGAAGVQHAVEVLRTELEMAMALLGAPRLAQLDRDLLWE